MATVWHIPQTQRTGFLPRLGLLTAKVIGPRGLLPGAVLGAVAFTALITVGTGLMTHQLKNASATYGPSAERP